MQPLSLEEKLQQCSEQRKARLNSIALVRQGRNIIAKSIQGYSDQSKSQHLEEDSQVFGGSIAKPLAAPALLIGFHDLVKDEKSPEEALKAMLGKPLSVYIPAGDPIWAGKIPSWANQVTPHQLLSHTSGLKDFTESTCPCTASKKERKFERLRRDSKCSPSDFVSLFKNEALLRGNPYHYANSNYLLVSYLAEKILKRKRDIKQLEDFFSAFFPKLGMHNTAFTSKRVNDLRNDPFCKDFYKKLTFPHIISLDHKEGKPKITRLLEFEDVYLPSGSGSLITTAGDLLNLIKALVTKNPYIPEMITQMMTTKGSFVRTGPSNMRVYYCYGIWRSENALHQTVSYELNGSIAACYALAAYFPSTETREEICVAEVSNMRPSSKQSGKNLGCPLVCQFTQIIGDHYRPPLKLQPKNNWLDIFNHKTEEKPTAQFRMCTIL